MIEVYKIVHNYYNPLASVKFNFNLFGITRGNKFKLQKFKYHYLVFSIGLTIYNYNCDDLTGTGGLPVCIFVV